MARTKGTYSLSANIEPKAAAPLDARTVVPTLTDLTASGAFPYPYVGMIVSVQSEGKIYMLNGEDPTSSSNWIEVATSSEIPSTATLQPKTMSSALNIHGTSKTTVESALADLNNNVLARVGWGAQTSSDIYWSIILSTGNYNKRGILKIVDRSGTIYFVSFDDTNIPTVTKMNKGSSSSGIIEIRCSSTALDGAVLQIKSKTYDKVLVEFFGRNSLDSSTTLTVETQTESTNFDNATILKFLDLTDTPIRASFNTAQNSISYVRLSLESTSSENFFGILYIQDRIGNLYMVALNGNNLFSCTKISGNYNNVTDKAISGIRLNQITSTNIVFELKLASWTRLHAWFVPANNFNNSYCTLEITSRSNSEEYDDATTITIKTLATTDDIPSMGDYIEKSSTAGLVKNDGSIDTNTYLTQHQDISGKADKITSPTANRLAIIDSSGNYAQGSVLLSNVAVKNAANTFSAANTFNGTVTMTGAVTISNSLKIPTFRPSSVSSGSIWFG